MQQPSTVALALRAVAVFLICLVMVLAGAAIDLVAGSSPVAMLAFLATALIFGVTMLIVIFISAFPRPAGDTPEEGKRSSDSH